MAFFVVAILAQEDAILSQAVALRTDPFLDRSCEMDLGSDDSAAGEPVAAQGSDDSAAGDPVDAPVEDAPAAPAGDQPLVKRSRHSFVLWLVMSLLGVTAPGVRHPGLGVGEHEYLIGAARAHWELWTVDEAAEHHDADYFAQLRLATRSPTHGRQRTCNLRD